MPSDDDDLDLGLQGLRWPTPPSEVANESPAGEPVPANPRDAVPDLLEQEIQQARANGTSVPLGVVQQYALPTMPAPQTQPWPPGQSEWTPEQKAAAFQAADTPQPVPVFVRPIERRLFVALQTIPDYDRISGLRLPELPAIECCEYDSLPNPVELAQSRKHATTLTNLIIEEKPPIEWLETLLFNEQQQEPGRIRKKLVELCQERIAHFEHVQEAIAERVAVFSHVPEFAQIIGLAFACGDGPVHSLAVGQAMRGAAEVTERALLALFWQSLQVVDTLVCWGDPRPMLHTRSCLVGVGARMLRHIDVEDLSKAVVGDQNLGPHTLEDVCQLYGVDAPVDPLPSQLMIADSWGRKDYTGIQQSSQVRLTMLRRLWQRWEGFHVARNT